MQVRIENVDQDFYLKKMNLTHFFITLVGLGQINKTLELEVEIVKKKVYSQENSKLLNYLLNGQINHKGEGGIFFGTGVKPAVQVAITSSVAMGFVSNPAGLWSLINTIQPITYMPINAVPYSERLRDTSTSLMEYNIIPNVMSLFCDDEATSRPSDEVKEFGIKSSVILLNAGPIWMIFVSCLASTGFLLIISKFYEKSEKIQKYKKRFKYNILIRFWIEAYLEVGIYGFIQIKAVRAI